MIWLVKEVDGEMMMSANALALICGIEVGDVDTRWRVVEDMPDEWIKAARRRTREAASEYGSYSVVEILRYWAHKDLDTDLVELDGAVFIP